MSRLGAMLLVFIFGHFCLDFVVSEDWTVQLRMPQVAHRQKDLRICTSVALTRTSGFIVGFEHVGPPGVVHHMFAYGCAEPAGETWECGLAGHRCKEGPGTLMYAWANDAPPLVLPDNVGYELSPKLRYIVAELHYGHASDEPDSSGMDIHLTTGGPNMRHAGVYILIVPGYTRIPANTAEYKMDEQCTYGQGIDLKAFAYRVHTHKAGSVVWAKKLDKHDHSKDIVLGKRNPQLAQSFVPMAQEVDISRGDLLHAQCVFNTTGHPAISIGGGMADEMCNFYILAHASRAFSTIGCSGGREFQM